MKYLFEEAELLLTEKNNRHWYTDVKAMAYKYGGIGLVMDDANETYVTLDKDLKTNMWYVGETDPPSNAFAAIPDQFSPEMLLKLMADNGLYVKRLQNDSDW